MNIQFRSLTEDDIKFEFEEETGEGIAYVNIAGELAGTAVLCTGDDGINYWTTCAGFPGIHEVCIPDDIEGADLCELSSNIVDEIGDETTIVLLPNASPTG